ncbi:MAG TPA: CBS domain-containing protein [Acidisoma sp.]|jgi:CBS domain-containing protein|uniref:CBS domain-containing protein n=1 Tax=Acidisoma sp. TaxID=1872115 RepID=UPI002CC4C70B|nr:CBS domain-containing protein [Acidisoma sp.]HTI00656.1 CBS domain-containing protein [Acidisoma sp.]
MSIKAADIMTRAVVTAKPEDTVRVVAKRLAEHGISAVPVCDDAGHVVGMVSEGDLLRPFTKSKMLKRAWWLELLAEGQDLAPEFQDYLRLDGRRARDLMTTPVVTATEGASLNELADLITEKEVKRLPILRDGALVGIVSRADVVRALARGEMS